MDKRSLTSSNNGKLGGRPTGPATIEREKAKAYIAINIGKYMPQIFKALIKKASKGDVLAIRELFDRGFGKASQAIEMSGKDGNPLLIQISEAIARKNGLDTESE